MNNAPLERLASVTQELLEFIVPAVGDGFSCEGCRVYAPARSAIQHHRDCPVPAVSAALTAARTALRSVVR